MKYTKQYATESAYNSDTTRVKPNISLITDEMNVKYNPLSIDGKVAKAGTIVLAKDDEKIFVPYNSFDKTQYNGYTPIGVVVVPFTHTPDNTVRIMSLKNMSISAATTGSVELGPTVTAATPSDISMYWGGYNVDLSLTNYDKIPNIDPRNQGSGTVGLTDWVRIPGDYLTGGTASTLDVGTHYYNGTESGRFGISPYVQFDWKSYEALSIYKASDLNCMLDYDGSGNTSVIMAANTAQTIVNTYTSGNYPAAATCHAYATEGIGAGEWYLPAEGELLYIVPRYNEINAALTVLMAKYPTEAVRLWNYGDTSSSVYGTWLWSSTEFSATHARTVGVDSGTVYSYGKNNVSTNNRVRAFAALSI